jgi:hypothetical protein
LGEVASSLFRDLTSEFSAAKNCGWEYRIISYVEHLSSK